MHSPITYSSSITLSMTQFHHIYFYTDGFMTNEFQIKSFQHFYGNLFNDFHKAVFKIIPVTNFKWTQQLLEDVVSNDFASLQNEPRTKERKSIIQTLSANLDGEINSNISLSDKFKGTPLIFGSSTFHLVHVASLKFLTINDDNIEDIRFELKSFPNEGSILKFIPCLQFQKMRTNIVYSGDAAVVAAQKQICNRYPNLYTEYKGIHFGSKEEEKEIELSRILASIEDQTRWRINGYHCISEFEKGVKTENYLEVGDVIALYLSEKQMHLNAIQPYDSFKRINHLIDDEIGPKMRKKAEVSVNVTRRADMNKSTFKKVSKINTSKMNTTAQVEEEPVKKRQEDVKFLKEIVLENYVVAFQDIQKAGQVLNSVPSTAFWKIESSQFYDGGKVSWENFYRLKHFQTGRYLKVVKQETQIVTSLTYEPDLDTLFMFYPISNAESKEEHYLYKDSFYYLYHQQTRLFLGITEEFEEKQPLIKEAEDNLGIVLSQGHLTSVQGHFNTFRIKRIDYSDLWEASLLIYSIPTCMEGISFINQLNNITNFSLLDEQAQQLDEIKAKIYFYRIYQKLFAMLENFQSFVSNKLVSHIEQNQQYSMIVPKRQNDIRHQQIIILLGWLLYRMFPSKSVIDRLGDCDYNQLVLDFLDEKEFMVKVQSFLQNQTISQHPNILKKLDQHHQKRKLLLSYKIYLAFQDLGHGNHHNQQVILELLKCIANHIGSGDEVVSSLANIFSQNHSVLQRLPHIKVYGAAPPPEELKQAELQANRTNMSVVSDTPPQPKQAFESNDNFVVSVINRLHSYPSYTKPDIISFLSIICCYKDTPIYGNQQVIFRNLIQNAALSKHSLITITYNEDIYLKFKDDDGKVLMKKLIDFFDESQSNFQLQKQYNYLTHQLNLFANLCLNRNVEANKMFASIFSLNVLTRYVLQDKLDLNLKAVLLKFIRTLYVDKEPYSIVKKPNLIVMLDYNPEILIKKIFVPEKGIKAFMKYMLTGKRPMIEVTQQEKDNQSPQLYTETKETQNLINGGSDEKEMGKSKVRQKTMAPVSKILRSGDPEIDKEQKQLKQFLEGFKQEILSYIRDKYELIMTNSPSYKVYNVLTYEVIKIVSLLLQFGLFITELKKPQRLQHSKSRRVDRILEMNYRAKLKLYEEQLKESEMESLVNYLATLLEYDEAYFMALNTVKLTRKYVERRREKEQEAASSASLVLKKGMGMLSFKSIFTEDKEEKKEKRVIQTISYDAEIISDPIFKKIKGLKKILQKCSNKTFTFKEQSASPNYERDIKIEICQIFSFLLDVRQDQLVLNAIGYFKEVYVPTIVQDPDFKDFDLVQLLPENQLEIGQDTDKLQLKNEYTEILVRNLDKILERPFYESLILSLYFSNDPKLQYHIVDLIQRFSSQKRELIHNLQQLQLLINPAIITFYKQWFILISSIKRSISHCPEWLQLDTPARLNLKNEENLNQNMALLLQLESDFARSEANINIRIKQNMFIHVGGFDSLYTLIQQCFNVMDTDKHIFKFKETEDNVVYYKQKMARQFIELLKITMSILNYITKGNQENQVLVHDRLIKKILQYKYNNFGQVSFLVDLYGSSPKLVEKIHTTLELKYFMSLIRHHGKYYQFLDFFNSILSNQKPQDLQENPDLSRNILNQIYLPKNFDKINPFSEFAEQMEEFFELQFTGFYPHRYDLNDYRDKFLMIVAKCLRVDVGVNLLNSTQQLLNMKEILKYLVFKSKVPSLTVSEQFDKQQVKQSIFDIVMPLINKTGAGISEFVSCGSYIQEFIEIETEEIDKKNSFTYNQQQYLFLKLVPIMLVYFKSFLQDASSQLFSTGKAQKQDHKRIYNFGQVIIKAISYMPTPDLLSDKDKMKSIHRLCDLLQLKLPQHLQQEEEELKHQREQQKHERDQQKMMQEKLDSSDIYDQFDPIEFDEYENNDVEYEHAEVKGLEGVIRRLLKKKRISQKSEQLDSSAVMMKYWDQFVTLLEEDEKVHKEVKQELFSFSNSLWNVSEMFQSEVKGDQKDLLLNSEDLLFKLLNFIEFWKQNHSQQKNVIFVIKAMYKILMQCEDDGEELVERQVIFNKLNAVKIVMKLIWNENEKGQEYLNNLLKFINILLKGGNLELQQTIFEFANANAECEKFFYKLNTTISTYIVSSSNRAKKISLLQTKVVQKMLRLIQLFCEGHYLDLQQYIHFQTNSKNSYDLVLLTVKLVTQIKIDNMNYEMVIQCLETLIDTVQGPCKKNQISISNSKFLEYAVQILSESDKIFILKETKAKSKDPKMLGLIMNQKFGKKAGGAQKLLKEHTDHTKSRTQLFNPDQPYHFWLHPGKLAKLKFKALTCILALLECIDPSDNLILRIIRAIPLKVMTENMSRIFSLLNKYEKGEYFEKLFNRADDEIDLTKDDDFSELIIQIGFQVYSLIQIFLSVPKGREILYEDADMREILDNFEEKVETKGLLGDSIFGELIKLAEQFFKSSVGAISSLKQGLDNALKSDDEKRKEEELKKKMEKKQLLTDSISFFMNNTVSIEFIRDEKIYRVYFPKLPCCHLLPKELKNDFHDDVNRSTPKSKITDLMNMTEYIVNTMRHEEMLKEFFKFNPLLGILVNRQKLWEQLSFITTLGINFIVCVSYSSKFMDERDIEEDDPNYKEVLEYERLQDPRLFLRRDYTFVKSLITTLGLVELSFSSLIVSSFLIKRAPLKIYHIWKGLLDMKLSFFRMIFVVIKKSVVSFFVLLQDFDILFYSVYILAGIVGLTIHPFFYAIHLMEFLKLEQLKTVVKAIWQPRIELGLALLLLLILEYYFGIVGYMVFYNHYEDYFNPDAVKNCADFWRCYIVTFDWTFKYTGAIGARLIDHDTIELEGLESDEDYDNVSEKLPKNFYLRFFFDNIFNIILVFILLNMIQGIIIDTFGSLREELADKLHDQEFICFICGIDMEKLDKSSDTDKGFQFHIKKEHYMWNYVFYRAYIDFKENTEYDGNETYIQNQVRDADISWFPIGRAKCVQDEENEDAKKEQLLYKIKITNIEMKQEFHQVEQRIESLREYFQVEEIQ